MSLSVLLGMKLLSRWALPIVIGFPPSVSSICKLIRLKTSKALKNSLLNFDLVFLFSTFLPKALATSIRFKFSDISVTAERFKSPVAPISISCSSLPVRGVSLRFNFGRKYSSILTLTPSKSI